ncbi:7-methylguanosine phosphate-specific 5'-nucleotidase [Channa argus]|uniref:7-methylguanosine phosphate-specific 5'-nucleotidase n=1 Tax=Channa argus TaxID=215402 RepID=A0A6G1QNW8_CHAAH|nr:7-methylguanosine phosphate-specific 5'-nucleotidase [Channa argus]
MPCSEQVPVSLQMRELLNTYYPIEIDANLRFEEKLALMVEGDGCKVFFDSLSEHQVPLLILSAGVGDVLEEVIRQNHVFHPNIHVISNYMEFDLTGLL